ncbi:MAG: hypothetical protein A2Y23_04415 [Clostridiales bacterium GWB2_37_7]|nr:MAG: hypothetical protein A2Y23_04415 [Clostridiales bacterium GWB2_37_7]
MESARMTIEGDHIRKITDILCHKENICYKYNAKDVVILMEEEYYMRIESNLLSVYILNFKDERTVETEMVAGGGKSGGDIGWGAENSENRKRVHSIIEICSQNSWSILEVYPERLKQSLEKSDVQRLMESVFPWFKK